MSSGAAFAWIPADMDRLRDAYALGISRGVIQRDPAQEEAVQVLDRLGEAVTQLEKSRAGAVKGLWGRLTGAKTGAVEGVYLVGDVGRGKSMLMDMFFSLVPVEKKRRVHFHAFMQETHRAFAALQTRGELSDDPVTVLAKTVARKYTLLCFDEFQMHDMSDAVVILRLLNALCELGTVLVATSNTAPENLLEGHSGRVVMLPFIRKFAGHMRVVHLEAARDYRRGRDEDDRAWIVPADDGARARLDEVFARYATGPEEVGEVAVGSRKIVVPRAAGRVARFGFMDLCDRALGPGDYLALARAYPVIVLDDVPQMGQESFDRARRFISLIDVLYEQKSVLFVSSDCLPEDLYREGENARIFERTASRLEEMRSRVWMERGLR